MKATKKITRSELVELALKNDGTPLVFNAYFLARKNESWLTFSQLTLEGSEEVLARHFNLPEHKMEGNFKAIDEVKNQKVVIKAIPAYYTQQGTRKGTLIGFGEGKVMEVNLGR
jgi:hypothetical protein